MGKKLAAVERFTKKAAKLDEKLTILNVMRAHIEKEAWSFSGMTKHESLEQIDLLIGFCMKAKGLDIRAWA